MNGRILYNLQILKSRSDLGHRRNIYWQKTAAITANFCQIVQPTLTEGRKLFLLIAAKRTHGRFINSPNLGILCGFLPSHMAHSLEMSSQVDCSLYFKLN